MSFIYLDNNATTRVDPQVVAAMLPYFVEHFGNASSAHGAGAIAARAVREARKAVQVLIGARSEEEILFTSGATESNHSAVWSALEAGSTSGRNQLVLSAVEHPSLLLTAKHLEASKGIEVRFVPVDGAGRIDLEAYQRALSPRTALASVMWANNETGNLHDVARLAELAHEAGALFHADAVQAAGRVMMDVKMTSIDFLSLSAHKLHGPKGVGALYVKKGVRFHPTFRGGKQERGRRGGTENVPGIVGFGKAAELATAELATAGAGGEKRVRALRDRLEAGILARIPGCRVNGDPSTRLGNTTNISFERVDGEAVIELLNRLGIAAASGAACASGLNEPSHVLRAMRVPLAMAMGAIRFSLSKDNSDEEIDQVLEALPRLIESLRKPRPVGSSAEMTSSQCGSQPGRAG